MFYAVIKPEGKLSNIGDILVWSIVVVVGRLTLPFLELVQAIKKAVKNCEFVLVTERMTSCSPTGQRYSPKALGWWEIHVMGCIHLIMEHASSLSNNGNERSNEIRHSRFKIAWAKSHMSVFLCHFLSALESLMPGLWHYKTYMAWENLQL